MSEKNPKQNPPNSVSVEQAAQIVRNGGRAAVNLDSPTFMRKEQQNPAKLPEHQPSKSTSSN